MPTPFTRTTRALAQDDARPALLAWALALLGLVAWALWCGLGSVTVHEVSPQARVEARSASHPVAAELPGRLLRSALVLGQAVQAGQLLAELDDSAARQQQHEAQARLPLLLAEQATLRAELAAAQAQAGAEQAAAQATQQAAQARADEAAAAQAHAADQARRLTDEARAGSVALVDALAAQAQARQLAAAGQALLAEARRQQADAQVRQAQGHAAVARLQRHLLALDDERGATEGRLQRSAQEIGRHQLRAPVAGRIGELAPLRPGEVVAAGQRFASVVPEDGLVVVAEFEPAAVLGRVRPGQAARLRLDGFPWAQHGSVPLVVQRVASELRGQRIRVELVPTGPWPASISAQHGLPGAVEVAVETVAPAVLLLRAAGQWLGGPAATAAPAAVAEAAAAQPNTR